MSLTLMKRTEPVPESTGSTLCGLLGVREVPLRGGGVAFVDESDLPRIAAMPWRVKSFRRRPYVAACVRVGPGPYDWDYIYLHRHLCGLTPGDGLCVDHIDGDALNNRRSNLRICTRGENSKNRGQTRNRLGFKGVSGTAGRFNARYNARHLGCFDTPIEAALAYNHEAQRRAGRFARPNAISDEQRVRELIARRDELRQQADAIDKQLKVWPCT